MRTDRRSFLFTMAALPLAARATAHDGPGAEAPAARLAALERTVGGRLGVFALDTGSGMRIGHRADERFPFCSTFKVVLSGAVLARSTRDAGLLRRRIRYGRRDLAHYSPISSRHVDDGMTVAELCAAALQYSDNTAANQLIKLLGGPGAVTAYAHSIGNASFRLDRWETALNDAVPGDARDTSTPAAMAHSLQALALGDALPAAQRRQLNDWLLGNTTGAKRIQAALPAGWRAGDKTGSGDYGTANDLGIVWRPRRAPLVLALYYTREVSKAPWRDDVIASAARIVVDACG